MYGVSAIPAYMVDDIQQWDNHGEIALRGVLLAACAPGKQQADQHTGSALLGLPASADGGNAATAATAGTGATVTQVQTETM